MCYAANVGDSRAVLSGESGAQISSLSQDHKPCDEAEHKRITEAGGKIYQYNFFLMSMIKFMIEVKLQYQNLLKMEKDRCSLDHTESYQEDYLYHVHSVILKQSSQNLVVIQM